MIQSLGLVDKMVHGTDLQAFQVTPAIAITLAAETPVNNAFGVVASLSHATRVFALRFNTFGNLNANNIAVGGLRLQRVNQIKIDGWFKDLENPNLTQAQIDRLDASIKKFSGGSGLPVAFDPSTGEDKTDFKVDFEQLEIKKQENRIERERKVKNQTATDVTKIVVVGSSQTGDQISTS